MLKHVPDKGHLVPLQEFIVEEVPVKLDRDLLDFVSGAPVGKPSVLQVGTYQHKLQVADFFHMVTDHTPGAFGMLYKVQLKLFMMMQGEIEFILYTGEKGKTIALGQWGDLPENFIRYSRHVGIVVLKLEKRNENRSI
jgi:hypothetical protein